MNSACVITTIQKPTAAVRKWEKLFGDRLIVIGDKKSPAEWECGKARYYSLDTQNKLPLESLKFTPENHYARKNVGYLMAMHRLDTDCIFETDDDNFPASECWPNDGYWTIRRQTCDAAVVRQKMWCNVYQMMLDGGDCWPRGFPLGRIHDGAPRSWKIKTVSCPIQQELANADPDVDAVYRLTHKHTEIVFWNEKSIALGDGVWCPFNSQATWWFPDAYPLMYLPIHATFRMCDIWRGFVAQRCLWAMDKSVAFHSPATVLQKRNKHDLLKDFESECAGYLHNEAIAVALEKTKLKSGVGAASENLRTCYETMVAGGWLPADELKSVDAWIEDVKRITTKAEFRI